MMIVFNSPNIELDLHILVSVVKKHQIPIKRTDKEEITSGNQR